MKNVILMMLPLLLHFGVQAQKVQWERTQGGYDLYSPFYFANDTVLTFTNGALSGGPQIIFSTDKGHNWYDFVQDSIDVVQNQFSFGTVEFRQVLRLYNLNTKRTSIFFERSTTNGLTWELIPNYGFQIYKLFVQHGELLLLGNNHTSSVDTTVLFSSPDAGKTWKQKLTIPFSCRTDWIFATSNSLFFLISNDTIKKSIDNGRTFTNLTYNGKILHSLLDGITVYKEKIYILDGDKILVSSDDGETWNVSLQCRLFTSNSGYSGYPKFFTYNSSLIFLDAHHSIVEEKGYANLFDHKIYITHDGISWKEIGNLNGKCIYDVSSLDNNILLFNSSDGIYYSNDSGVKLILSNVYSANLPTSKLWASDTEVFSLSSSLNMYHNISNTWNEFSSIYQPYSVYISNDTMLVSIDAVTGIWSESFVASNNGGVSYNYTTGGYGSNKCSQYVKHKGKFYAILKGGTVIQSSDSSIFSYKKLATPLSTQIEPSIFSNTSTLFIGGSEVYKTLDEGKTWSKLDIPFYVSKYKLTAVYDNNLYAVNDIGEIYYSSNNGNDWSKLKLTPDDFDKVVMYAFKNIVLYASYFSSISNVISSFKYSIDFGKTWHEANTSTDIVAVNSIAINNLGLFASTNKGILRADLPIVSSVVPVKQEEHDWSITPNPVSDSYQLRITPINSHRMVKMVDYLGRVIKTIQLPSNEEELVVSCTEVPNGVYTITLQSGVTTQSRTIVISR